MKPKLSVLLSILFLLSINLQAQEKYSKVKIQLPKNSIEKDALLDLLQLDHFYVEGGKLITEVSEKVVKKLASSKFNFQVVIDDVEKNLKEINSKYYASVKKMNAAGARVAIEQSGSVVSTLIKKPTAFTVYESLGGYYSYPQMEAAIDALVTAYPTLIQKISIGKSYENRDIWAVKISDNVISDELNEPEILYTGLQHAREAISGSSLIFFMQYLLENYAADSRIKDLVDNREFYIVPCVNPDGYEYNRADAPNGGGGWRKNRSKVDSTERGKSISYVYGVDLNRNYGIDWGNCSGATLNCGSNDPTVDTYFGNAAFSEPETQAIRNLVISKHFVASIDQHAYGPYYSLPYGRPTLHPELSAPDKKFYTFVPALMGTYNGMRAGNSPESVNYEVAGGIKDWLLMGEIGTGTKGKIYGMTGEGGSGVSGGGTFWAPASQIVNLCQGMCFQNLQLAYAAGSYVNFKDVDDIAVSAKTGIFNFNVTRVGLQDLPVTISMIPVENIQSTGGPVTINSLPNYYDTYNGNINYTLSPSIANGQRIRFAWKIETGGYSYYDTITKFYNPTVLFSDDMEGISVATNWAVTGGWNYATDNKYAGAKSLVESPGTNYATNANSIAKYTGVLNLSDATAAYLNFWVRHRAENFRDKLQVQVSTNGTTWVAIKGSTTVQEPGTWDGSTINGEPSLTGIREDWTNELFDLTPYKGAAALQLRFVFTSDGDGGSFAFEKDDGFFIDNLKVVKSNTPLITLPVTFVDFYGKYVNEGVLLNWQALTDERHHHFEVQRSPNGIDFTTLTSIYSSPPFQSFDKNPIQGLNYYRIKQVDKDGKTMYSKVVTINVTNKIQLTVFPNPVKDELHIKLDGTTDNKLRIEITDIQGRRLLQQEESGGRAGGELIIPLKNWKSQLYILKVYDNNGRLLTTQKIMKL